ncbi:DUF6221 family protein [Amycolatopsis benzoatilytica]|uniref:DUF6221 family protein n=1 Tax=Amycolatopsis benzoatilytica TaxID=346045 RepID=UPI000367BEB0|nr:DUF6221 family protein [Amycolatopsis benzoatilytica]
MAWDVLLDFLHDRIEEDEEAARAACDPRGARRGEHWHWVHAWPDDPLAETPVTLDDDERFVGGHFAHADLRSVEAYPAGVLPDDSAHVVLQGAVEVEAGVARHIVRHDPSRVLSEADAKRRIIAVVAEGRDLDARVLRILALPYALHPDYRPEWRP